MGKSKNDVLVDTNRIRRDWGTVKHFCKKHGINYNTFRVVNFKNGKSSRIEKILRKYGYIK